MKNTEGELFNEYNYYRKQTLHFQKLRRDNPYLRELKSTPARLKLFSEMIKWCDEHQIQPKQWLYTLFAVRKWQYAPKLEKNHLLSEKHLERFQKFTNWDAYSVRQLSVPSGDAYDPNRDISNAVEQQKARFLESNQEELCFQNMFTITYGFHPLSEVCKRCPINERCLEELKGKVNYDVVALREGRLSAEDAKQQALAGVLRYDRR